MEINRHIKPLLLTWIRILLCFYQGILVTFDDSDV